MNAKQLKDSILQYAMQGKLVPQLETDEPAIKLVERIKVEKEVLIKKKQIKNEKALPPIVEDEIPFEIPETWEWMRLKELALYIKAGGDKPKEFLDKKTVDFPIPVIANGKVNKGIVGYTKVSKEDGNCITISGRGTIGYAEIRYEPFVPIVRLIVLKPSVNVSMEYLKVVLEALIETGVGTSIPQLTVPMISPKLIPVPPLEEQYRIAKKVKKLFEKVDDYNNKYSEIKSLNELFPIDLEKSILQHAMQGKLVEQDTNDEPAQQLIEKIQLEKERLIKEKVIKKEKPLPPITEEEIPFDIPSSWEWTRLGDIAFITKLAGFEYTKEIAPNLEVVRSTSNVPLVKGKNLKYSNFVEEYEHFIPIEVSNNLIRSQIKKRCLLTPYVGSIGNVVIFEAHYPAHLGSNVGKIEVLNPDKETLIIEEYVLLFLKSSFGYSQLTKYKKATAQESISIGALRDVFIPIPPLNEQKRILNKIEELMKIKEKLFIKN